MAGRLIVAQSGGCTAVINASLAGVIEEASAQPTVADVYGAVNGILGVLQDNLIDLGQEEPAVLAALRHTPSGALGSCRHKLSAEDIDRALDLFQRYDVRYFCYIGGNDSADTALRLSRAAADRHYELTVVGVPKTIDNDLPEMDHCPGYGSVARFVALATQDAGLDTEASATLHPIKIIEVMGRNAGWVAAASALGKRTAAEAPHLIYLPETPLDPECFLERVEQIYQRLGYAVVVVAETVRGPDGKPLTGDQPSFVDLFGHPYFEGPASYLCRLIGERLGRHARFDKPGTIQRMSMACASRVDLAEAYAVGREAVRLAVAGQTGRMVTLWRDAGPTYRCRLGSAPLEAIANRERRLPADFFDPATGLPTPAFRDYALPLLGDPLPQYARLARIPVKLAAAPQRSDRPRGES